MRLELLYNLRLFCERLAEISLQRRRMVKLRGTVAGNLTPGHVDSLELLELLRPLSPKVIYDVGANTGTWTQLAKAIFPDAEVHAFEPLKSHHTALLEKFTAMSNAHLHKVALGETSGTATMRVTNFPDSSSLLPLSPAGQKEWKLEEVAKEAVTVARMDDYRRETQISFPSLIKLDVQGFELAVLRGAQECLGQATAVLAEVSFQEFYKGQCLFHDVVTFLSGHGFGAYALGHGTVIDRPILQTDVLFLKPGKIPGGCVNK